MALPGFHTIKRCISVGQMIGTMKGIEAQQGSMSASNCGFAGLK